MRVVDYLGRRQTESLLWMSSGLMLWALHFVAVYVLFSLACAFGWPDARIGIVNALNAFLVVIAVPWLAALGLLGWSSWRYGRRLRARGDSSHPARHAISMSTAATLIQTISALGVLWVSLPIFLSHPC